MWWRVSSSFWLMCLVLLDATGSEAMFYRERKEGRLFGRQTTTPRQSHLPFTNIKQVLEQTGDLRGERNRLNYGHLCISSRPLCVPCRIKQEPDIRIWSTPRLRCCVLIDPLPAD
ncbi:hypothetical protein DL93DRAFT_728424 [Clavulina sp. PMI_390]|nr:hypothetical protein DL93DRAFT_728424 [Clavulina sp. PMI_390]